MNGNIFIAAHARSGSTFLCEVMKNIAELKVYLELFHFKLDVITQHLDGDYPAIAATLSLPQDPAEARTALVQRHPEYIAALHAINPGKIVTFKIFPGHLPKHALNGVIVASDLILILRRNILHSYISNIISLHTDKWGNFDTSKHQQRFIPADFLQHAIQITDYYRQVERLAAQHHKQLRYIDYESLAAADDPFSLIAALLQETLPITPHLLGNTVSSFKQDRRANASDKVSNPDDLCAFLKQNKLMSLDNGTTRFDDHSYDLVRQAASKRH